MQVDLIVDRKAKRKAARGAATTVVGPDGSFTGEVKLPRSEKAIREVRVTAKVAGESSRAVKLTRRARITTAHSENGRTTLKGSVLGRKVEEPPKLTVRRRVACKGENQWLKVATGKQKPNGTFKVTFDNPQGTVGSIFDVKTKYAKGSDTKAKRSTATSAVALDLG